MTKTTRSAARFPKRITLRGQLRGKFMERDRVERELGAIDLEIKAMVRGLSTELGLVTPMRVEQARQHAFGGEVLEAAE